MQQTTIAPGNRLNAYSKNIVSQTGEDGILEKVFELIPGLNHWCVEFGGWDGKLFSNTWNLITNNGWSGVVIEADKKRFKDLVSTYSENKKVTPLNKFVNFEGENSLDNLLSKTNIPKDFDLLSIDIDGNDYHIWDSVKKYNPKVVVIEMNPSIPNDIEFVQPKDMKVNQGTSLLSLTKLGKEKGYELICCTELNGIYVKREFYPLFDIENNSVAVLNPQPASPRVFHLYDGTIVLTNEFKFRWCELRVTNKNIQVIPAFLRFYDGANFPGWKKSIRSFFFKLKGGI